MRALNLKIPWGCRAWLAGLLGVLILSSPWSAVAQTLLFQESSQPQGILASQSNYVAAGSSVQTVIAPTTSSGYGFAYWAINGQRAVAASGQSLTVASVAVTSATTAIAVYLPLSQSTNGNGIPDYLELFYYGSTTNSLSSDTDGDGFTFSQEIARGYDPTIYDTTTNGGALLRMSDTATYVAGPLQYFYQIQSQPAGIIASTSGYAPAGTTIQTPDISYGQSSGYYFVGWLINGLPQRGATGASLDGVSLNMTNSQTATALFVSASQTPGGLANWYGLYWFNTTNETTTGDPTGDGFTIAQDISRDYSPVVASATTNGGAILRLSDVATYVAGPLQYYYQIQSQPAGIIASTSGYALAGASIQTPDVSYGQSDGYYFVGWLVNGVPQVGVTGASLNGVTLDVTNNQIATAVFVAVTQTTGGLPTWYGLYWLGETNATTNSDPTGDGFTIGQDIQRGYSPVVANATTNGGAILRMSDMATYVAGPLQYFYQIQSQPEGIIASTSGYALAGATLETPDISYGQSDGYYFVGWLVNGLPQQGVTGASLNGVSLNMTNNQIAIAVFVSASQTPGGLANWYGLYWFNNTNETTTSDPTGDGYLIGQDIPLGYSPVVANATTNGGAILRLSDSVSFVPIQLPCCNTLTIAISAGQIELTWTAGGVLQSAPNVNGPYADVPNAPDPYFITPTAGQMFFRVRFPG